MNINWKLIPIQSRVVVKNGEIDVIGTLELVDDNGIVIKYSLMNDALKRMEEKTIRVCNNELETVLLMDFDINKLSLLKRLIEDNADEPLSAEELKYAKYLGIFKQNNLWSISFGDIRHIAHEKDVVFTIIQNSIDIHIYLPNGVVKATYSLKIKHKKLYKLVCELITGNM